MFLILSATYLSPRWGLGHGFWRFYTPSAPLGLLNAGAHPTNVLFKQALREKTT